MGASETLSHLRAIARSLHAWVVPTQVSVAGAEAAFNSSETPLDSELGDRLATGSALRALTCHPADAHAGEDRGARGDPASPRWGDVMIGGCRARPTRASAPPYWRRASG